MTALRASNVAHQILKPHVSGMVEVEMPWAVHPIRKACCAGHTQDIGSRQV
jgi:hypothetical protein